MTLAQVFKGTLVVLLALATAYLIVVTLNVWISVLVAILVASAVRPYILRLMRFGVSQVASILLVYGGLAAATITLLLLVMPPIINQFVSYLDNEDRLANRIISAQNWVERTVDQLTEGDVEFGLPPEEIRDSVSNLIEQVRITAPSLVGNATTFIGELVLIIVMGLYWITTRERTEAFLVELVPLGNRAQLRLIMEEIEVRLGSYVRSIVLVSVIVGFICFVVLLVLRVPGAGTISFFYAVATAIPVIGGLIGVALATLLALLTSPTAAIIVLVLTFLLQQFENYYLTPRMMSQGTDFDPLLVIVFVSMGFTLGGITGSLIAVPIAGIVSILTKHLILDPRKATVAPAKVEGGILLHVSDLTKQPEK
ncbi:MAG: AI-2E family transporter [Chloroflexota bacterium]|nr:AI-2E family transporter [Chloroflexota bacterium]